MTEKFLKIAVMSAATGISIAAGYLGNRLHKLTKKVGMAVEDLAGKESKDISQELIERSVEKAAKQEVKRYAADAASEALSNVRTEVKTQVKQAVSAAFDEMKTAVEEEITKQVSNIDHKALQKDVTEKAKEKILEKFDGNLDDILKDFSDNLDRVKKIYTSISDTLSERDSGKEIRFKVG
jgi:hypothetical protein